MSWSVLAYIVADDHGNTGDSLDDAAREDLGKLLAAAHQNKVPIAAQIDYEGSPGIWRQIMGAAGGNDNKVRRREANSSRTEVLKDFLEWGQKACPADHYLVMLWGHGSGPSGFFSDSSKNTPARAAGHPLNPRDLANALSSFPGSSKNEPPFDILLTKSCFAATLEVAHQLAGSARFLIASQNLIPSHTFWPYPRIFQRLSAHASQQKRSSETEIRAIGRQILAEIGAFYDREENRPGKVAVPYSLMELENSDTAAKSLADLVVELKKHPVTSTDHAAQRSRPGDPGLVDIARFCDNLADLADEPLTKAAQEIRATLKKLVVDRHPQTDLFQGISLFYHPGYGMHSPVRDTARFGLYRRSKLANTQWIDIAFQNSQISRLAQKGESQ